MVHHKIHPFRSLQWNDSVYTEICSTVITINSEHFITSERNQKLTKQPLPLSLALNNHLGAVYRWACLFCVFQIIGVAQVDISGWLLTLSVRLLRLTHVLAKGWFLSFA